MKEMEELNRKREKEMSQKIFKFPDQKKAVLKPLSESPNQNIIVDDG